MFFQVDKKAKVDRLYLMEIWMDEFEQAVIKIGKASGKDSVERMLQIIRSYHKVYRKTPAVKIVRDREVTDVFKKETELHQYFSDKRANCEKSFSGSTEVFHIGKDEAIEKYEEVIGVGDRQEECTT